MGLMRHGTAAGDGGDLALVGPHAVVVVLIVVVIIHGIQQT